MARKFSEGSLWADLREMSQFRQKNVRRCIYQEVWALIFVHQAPQAGTEPSARADQKKDSGRESSQTEKIMPVQML